MIRSPSRVADFVAAVQFLTRLPTPQIDRFDDGALGRASVYFPVVGLLIGAVVTGACWGGALITPWVGALLGVIAWGWVTGGLHLDGLGDVVDALGAAHGKPERFHEVLSDPSVGSFAVMAIALQLAAKLVLLASLPIGVVWIGVALVPAWARWASLAWSDRLPPLKAGMGSRFATGQRGTMIRGWAVLLSAASLWPAPVLVVALAVMPAIGGYWRRKLGGITGDCLGASIEVMESLLLLALTVGARIGAPLTW